LTSTCRGGCRSTAVYQQYIADLVAGVKAALVNVDPTPFFAKYGDNEWAAVKTYQDAHP
jgi:hypothetical protein